MGRSPCCSKVGLHRGPWTTREDALLTIYIRTHGEGNWRSLPKKAGLLRCGKSCRLRWMNYLRPDIKRGNIGAEEEDLIVRLHFLLGNRWSLIAGRIPGRTDNEIKNYWNTHLSKKLRKQGFSLREAPRRSKRPNNNNNNNKNGLSDDRASEMEDQGPKIYAPKPIRFLPRLGEVSEMRMESSDASSSDSPDGDRLGFGWSPATGDGDDGLFQIGGFEHQMNYNQLEFGIDQYYGLSLQADDGQLERVYLEYSELLQSQVEMDLFQESTIVL
ncbi:hypothetical protein HPP92_021107 [Vanilla planifolia]|uniref:Uncharacterized protein n=1 Tax=Vanilla planifolia TaxID=51239 RepID=A0A835UH90_VANPL|nr:hypothetical protein HPP92_021107 [Vanilla planifolia]